jgi:hypothetical protein
MQEIFELNLSNTDFWFRNATFRHYQIEGLLSMQNGQMSELKLKFIGVSSKIYQKLEKDLSDIQIDKKDLKKATTIDFELDFNIETMKNKVYQEFEMTDYIQLLDLTTVEGEKTLRVLDFYTMGGQFLHYK